MCLAKAYVAGTTEETEPELLMENVTRMVVEGDWVRLTSLFGQAEQLLGRVDSVDFSEGRLTLRRSEAKDIEEKIAELRRRWPAHSATPAMWEELEEYESELRRVRQAGTEKADGEARPG